MPTTNKRRVVRLIEKLGLARPRDFDEPARCARLCRVARVMQPYLDSIA